MSWWATTTRQRNGTNSNLSSQRSYKVETSCLRSIIIRATPTRYLQLLGLVPTDPGILQKVMMVIILIIKRIKTSFIVVLCYGHSKKYFGLILHCLISPFFPELRSLKIKQKIKPMHTNANLWINIITFLLPNSQSWWCLARWAPFLMLRGINSRPTSITLTGTHVTKWQVYKIGTAHCGTCFDPSSPPATRTSPQTWRWSIGWDPTSSRCRCCFSWRP